MRYRWNMQTESPPPLDAAPPRKLALLLTALIWLVMWVVFTARSAWMGAEEYGAIAAGRAVFSLEGMVLCSLVYLVLDRLRSKSFWIQVTAAGLLAVPTSVVHTFTSQFIIFSFFIPRAKGLSTYEILILAQLWFVFFYAWAVSILALNYSHRVRFEQKMRIDAQALAHRAQMQALRYQLNPHFLFNALNSVSALVLDGKPVEAEWMIRALSDFLRRGLASDPLEDIPLITEVSQQRAYLDIERMRFPERLRVELDIPAPLEEALVPSFILQPLVENAVKHGVAQSAAMTTVRIAARRAAEILILSVADDGSGTARKKGSSTGIGLRNVQQRLTARFGERFGVTTAKAKQDGFVATVSLPFRLAEA
jgi:two-component system LytT family sensor kinase